MIRVSRSIEKLIPYKPGKPIEETQREYGLTKVVKLASNENPLGMSPKAIEALHAKENEYHLYPDAMSFTTLQAVAKAWNYDVREVTLGNGSNELIDLLIRVLCEPGVDSVAYPKYSFVAYGVCANGNRAQIFESAVDADLKPDLSQLAELVLKEKSIRLVFLANPNNPTGHLIRKTELKEFLKKVAPKPDLFVVIDEAYVEYITDAEFESASVLRKEFPFVLQLRTFSKVYGMGGVRLGSLLAPEELIGLINRVRNPFNVSVVAQVAGAAAVGDTDFIKKTLALNQQQLPILVKGLTQLGFKVFPSQVNFVLVELQKPQIQLDAQTVYIECLKRGLILRPVANYGLHNHLRISVGSESENSFALEVLNSVLKV